jgi:peroxiredoxin
MVEAGQPAPSFTLKDHTGQEISLEQFKEQRYVVLHVFPAAFTSG